MALVVQKFGGTSVATAARLRAVAEIIARSVRCGDRVVAVLSAQGKTTDRLVRQAMELSPAPCARELDLLLSSGEQMSVALCAMALSELGIPAVSLTGWQAGLLTDSRHGDAHTLALCSDRIARELSQGKVVLVAGFQGIDAHGDITTLGRGGSDTTAVALSVFLHADKCQIFTDVDGVYTDDPRKNPDAVRLDVLSYDRMLSMARSGAKVLHERCVALAKQHNVEIEVRSSFTEGGGTRVCATE